VLRRIYNLRTRLKVICICVTDHSSAQCGRCTRSDCHHGQSAAPTGHKQQQNNNTNSTTTSSNSLPSTSSGIASSPKTLLIGAGGAQTLRLGKNVLLATSNVASTTTTATAVTTTATPANNLVFAVQGNGGQLFFSPGLQGVNLKPLSSMKVIPMSSTASTLAVNSGVKLNNVATTTTLNTKLLPTAVLKTASGGHGN